MKTIPAILLVSAVAFFLASCGDSGSKSTGKPVVFASLAPVAGILERICGDEVEVRVFVGEGQDPHDFSPSTGQLAALGSAKALFLSGMDFEAALRERLEGDKSGLKLVNLAGHGEEEGEAGEDGEEDHHHHEGCNHAHTWLSPEDLLVMVEEAEEALGGIFPDKATIFGANAKSLRGEIAALHEGIAAKLKPFEGRSFFTYHGAFDAFACTYDLDENAVEVDGKPPTPRELADFLEKARAEGAQALIVQPQFDTKSAEAVARQLEMEIVSIDPMARDVLGNIRLIADSIAKTLR